MINARARGNKIDEMICEVARPKNSPRGSSRQKSIVNLSTEYSIIYARIICPSKVRRLQSHRRNIKLNRLALAWISCVGSIVVSIGTPLI